jgi:peptidyl-tRNA hydrolase
VLQTQAHIAILVKEAIERYNKEMQSDKILFELMRFWKDVTKGKIVIKLPTQFSHKLFKSISSAMLDIYDH